MAGGCARVPGGWPPFHTASRRVRFFHSVVGGGEAGTSEMHLEVSHCGPPGLGRGCGLRVPWRLIGTGRRCENFYFPVISGHFRSFGPVGLLAQWQITGACKGNRDGETPENPSQIVPFRPILGISLRLTGVGRMRVAGAGWHKDALLSPLRVRVGPGPARVLRPVSNNGREVLQGLARGGCQLQGSISGGQAGFHGLPDNGCGFLASQE